MAQEYVTQEELEAAVAYAIRVLQTIETAVHGATYRDGRIMYRVPIPEWNDRVGLSVGGRPNGCDSCRPR